MKNIKYISFILFSIIFINKSFSQFSLEERQQIDSLNAVIKSKSSHDTTLAITYNLLSEILASSNLDTIIDLCSKAQNIAEKGLKSNPSKQITKSFRTSLATSLNNIGYVHMNKSNNALALKYYFKSLEVEQENDNKKGMASAYNNIGLIYYNQGDIPLALEFYHKSLKIKEDFGDKKGMAMSFNNIGFVYNEQHDTKLALEYYNKSLALQKEIGNKKGMAMSYNNIGLIYLKQDEPKLALNYFQKSLKLKEEIGDKKGIANSYHNIGKVYKKQGANTLALEFFNKSLSIRKEIEDKDGLTYSYIELGELQLSGGNITEARHYAEMGLQISKEIGFPDAIEKNAKLLTTIAIKQGYWKEAFEMRDLSIQMHDSIASDAAIKATANQQAKYKYEKEKAILDLEQGKKDVVVKEEKQRQNIVIIASIAGLFLVLLFLFILFKRFKIIQKQKNIIQKQKNLVDEKHKEITDSINYAERIQRTFMATTELLDQNLKDYFIFFKPKDVVSGDFYWGHKLNNGNFILATADSTGHGVPGAIMSLLNITGLEKAIENYSMPNEILNHTRQTIINRLKKDGSVEGGKDGMDCSLIAFDFTKMELQIAVANNPVWIVKSSSTKKELIEIKAEKMPVGKHDRDSESFVLHTVNLDKGDMIYTLTDGFPDQFGGDKKKKFMTKNLKTLLLDNSSLPTFQQKNQVEIAFKNWIGNLEQVDDVTLIGIRV